MPYDSAAQRRFFHTDTARRAGITPAMVREYDEASKGRKLPEHAEKSGAAYGVPKIPPVPKPPTPGVANTLGAKPGASYRGVPPLAQAPQTHKAVASLSTMSSARASDTAAKGSAGKLNAPTSPGGS